MAPDQNGAVVLRATLEPLLGRLAHHGEADEVRSLTAGDS